MLDSRGMARAKIARATVIFHFIYFCYLKLRGAIVMHI
jgi:hypothetical protein